MNEPASDHVLARLPRAKIGCDTGEGEGGSGRREERKAKEEGLGTTNTIENGRISKIPSRRDPGPGTRALMLVRV